MRRNGYRTAMQIQKQDVPTRLVTGAYVFHSGWEKWRHGSPEQAKGVHGMASGAYPFLAKFEPELFLKLVGAAEMSVGALLLVPFVPNRLAGAALTAFSGGLFGMYLRTPSLRKPGSVWPTQAGIGVSKDSWMVGIGVGLLLSPTRERV